MIVSGQRERLCSVLLEWREGGHRVEKVSSILGALAWGWGSVLFQDLPPNARVDSEGQANKGGDGI